MARSLHIFDALEQAFTPFKFVPRMELTLWIWQWGVCLLSKASHWASAWKKWERVLCQIYHSPDSDMVLPPSLAVTMTALPRTISSVIQPTFSGTLIRNSGSVNYQMPVVTRNWGLRRIPLRAITVKAWLWKLIGHGYFSLIKKVYSKFYYRNNFSLI